MASECSKVYEHWKEICRREEPEGTSKSRFYDYLKDSGKYSGTTTDFFGQLKSNINLFRRLERDRIQFLEFNPLKNQEVSLQTPAWNLKLHAELKIIEKLLKKEGMVAKHDFNLFRIGVSKLCCLGCQVIRELHTVIFVTILNCIYKHCVIC